MPTRDQISKAEGIGLGGQALEDPGGSDFNHQHGYYEGQTMSIPPASFSLYVKRGQYLNIPLGFGLGIKCNSALRHPALCCAV